MEGLLVTGKVIMILLSLAVIVMVLMHSGKGDGLSGLMGGGGDSFFARNKGKSYEARLGRFTTITAAILVILSMAMVLLSQAAG